MLFVPPENEEQRQSGELVQMQMSNDYRDTPLSKHWQRWPPAFAGKTAKWKNKRGRRGGWGEVREREDTKTTKRGETKGQCADATNR
jgi:hypothetical protein